MAKGALERRRPPSRSVRARDNGDRTSEPTIDGCNSIFERGDRGSAPNYNDSVEGWSLSGGRHDNTLCH